MHPSAPRTIIGSAIAITMSLIVSTHLLADEWTFQHASSATRPISTDLRTMPASERDPLIVLLALDPAQQRILDELDAARLRDMHDAWLPFVEWDRLTNFAAGQGLVQGDQYRAERADRLKPVEAAAERAQSAMDENLQLILADDQHARWTIAARWRTARQLVQWSPAAGVATSDLVPAFVEAMREPAQDQPEALHAIGHAMPMHILDQWITDLEAAQRRLGSVAESFSTLSEEFNKAISTGARMVDGRLVVDPDEAAASFNAEQELRPRMAQIALRAIPIYEHAAARTLEHAQRIAETLNPEHRKRFLRRIEQDKSTMGATGPAHAPPSPTLEMIEKIEHLIGQQLIQRPLPFHHSPIHDLVRARWQAPPTNALVSLSPDQRRTLRSIAESHIERIAPLRESLANAMQDNPQRSMLQVRAGDWVINLNRERARPHSPTQPHHPADQPPQAILRQLAEIEIQTVEQLREALTIEQRIEIQLLQ